jgi:shikimate kinase/3-dehydroquinate synthase
VSVNAAPVFVVGFMATGKTTVGRLVASRLGRRFVDLDDAIAAAAGEPAAAIVARDEADFRRREAAALAVAIAGAGDGPVIATGGGCAAHGDNIDRMRAAGLVVALTASLAEVRRRAAAEGTARPLLAGGDARVAALAAARDRHYRRAHVGFATDDRTPDEIARAIARVVALGGGAGDTTWVGVGERAYPIAVDDGDFDATSALAPIAGATSIAVLVDAGVAAHWGAAIAAALAGRAVVRLDIPAGEPSKSLATYGRACDDLIAGGLDRGGAIAAIGGGVVGDLGGFVAATLFRGIPIVHVPTTIVAMADSAIGGKTAIDLAAGKNLVGAFWQPRRVATFLGFLRTLPARERRAGFGELWKYALLDGESLWSAIEAIAPWAAAGEYAPPPPGVAAVIRRAAAVKAWVVGQDEHEQGGDRILLNLGHTVGHAIESEHGLLHGEAVALGLVAACHVSAALGLAPPDLAPRVAAAVAATGLPSDPRPLLDDGVLARLTADKKRRGVTLRFVAVREVGSCETAALPVTDLVTILRSLKSP